MDFAFQEVPFPATSEGRSQVNGNGTEWEVKIKWIVLNKMNLVELNKELFLLPMI